MAAKAPEKTVDLNDEALVEALDAPKAEDDLDEQVEAIEPRYDAREWIIKDDQADFMRVYIQKPLSFSGKLQVTALLTKTLKKAMDDGLSVDGVMQTVDDATGDDFGSFVQSIITLVEYAPDLVADLSCLSLHVPTGEREWVKSMWNRPEDEGGLSDNDGIEMIEIFVDQNVKALKDFFAERIPKLFRRVTSRLGTAAAVSAPSKPLKRTAAPTPRQ
jgi:hypothetical protein